MIPTINMLQKSRAQDICGDNYVNMMQIKEFQFIYLDVMSDRIQAELL